MCGYVQHKRARQKALEAFKKKAARVLVLDLLVSVHVELMRRMSNSFGHYLMSHCATCITAVYVQSQVTARDMALIVMLSTNNTVSTVCRSLA